MRDKTASRNCDWCLQCEINLLTGTVNGAGDVRQSC